MLDLKYTRENPEQVREGIKKKGETGKAVDELLQLDQRWRQLKLQIDEKRAQLNRASKEIGEQVKAGQDVAQLQQQMRELGDEIKEIEQEERTLDGNIKQLLLQIPNPPHPEVPVGKDEEDNRVVREWGEQPRFSFAPRPHWELAEELGLVDFKWGAKIAGANFIVFKDWGARLERALINFMLELHTQRHGYREVFPPFMVNREAMIGTGQLPKFEEDMYGVKTDDLFLNPTAEVPVTNLHQGEILNSLDLPIYYTAYTACFRREAGSYGRETRGLTRIHQFDKVELVKFTLPEESYKELEQLMTDAEEVLQLLGLHYRVVELCTGELGFAAAKCYDLELWAPAMEKYLEVSSCSNFEDFQARRAKIRFRRDARARPEFVHTLNGSGVALPRTVIALLETHQQADGSVLIPEPLQPYLKAKRLPPE